MSKHVTNITWDDVPHLDEAAKRELLESYPAYIRDARSKGIPQLGSGAIYPIAESDVVIAPFEIPVWWPRVYAMDVGWNRTAALWAAIDRETDTAYIYSEHYRGQAEPIIHAEAIKSRGDWIPGTIDPASRGRSQQDGGQLFTIYAGIGLRLCPADNSVESGIYKVWEMLSAGKIKVFSSLGNFIFEFRLYRRDDKGKIVKQNDHLMDCLRYLVTSGLAIAAHPPVYYQGNPSATPKVYRPF